VARFGKTNSRLPPSSEEQGIVPELSQGMRFILEKGVLKEDASVGRPRLILVGERVQKRKKSLRESCLENKKIPGKKARRQ